MKISIRRGVLAAATIATVAALTAPVPGPTSEVAVAEADATSSALADGVTHHADVRYGWARDYSGKGQRLEMDLWFPTGFTSRRPAVVLAHGGGFYAGTRKNRRIRGLAETLARHGYVTASISYRLVPRKRIGRPRGMAIVRSTAARDAQHDLQAAVRFLRHQAREYRIDRTRIAALGASAGGIAALRAAHNPEDPGRSGHRRYRSTVQAAVSLWGTGDHRMIERNAPPALMFHGREDRVLAFWAARKTCATTRRRADGCRKRWWPEEGHGPWHRVEEIEGKTLHFLDRALS